MSSTSARHRKSPPSAPADSGAAARHRKSAPVGSAPVGSAPVKSARRGRPVRAAACAVAGSALLICAGLAAAHKTAGAHHPAGTDQADAIGLPPAAADGAGPIGQQASPGVDAGQQPEIVSVGVAVASRVGKHRKPGQSASGAPGYRNPLRAISNLVPERIDMGVDFGGSGPIYALGDAVITNATGESAGWPGGGWITYQLTDGPDAGLMVYVAEDVTPTVSVGQHVTPSTVIANMFDGYDGIETGWAQPGGLSAESQLPAAGDIGGDGPFPTMIGVNFDELLESLGVPAAPNRDDYAYGILPANYPANGG